MKFASLGPFKVVPEPVTFQRIGAFLRRCESGKTEPAWAGAFNFAPAGFAGRIRLKLEVGGRRASLRTFSMVC
jgi:hypothetical protein